MSQASHLAFVLVGCITACQPRLPTAELAVEHAASTDETRNYQDLLAALGDPAQQAAAITMLRRVALAIGAAGDEQARARAAALIVPDLAARWPTASEHLREASLVIALALNGPEAAPLWQLALASGDAAQVELAVEALRQTEQVELGAQAAARLMAELGKFDSEDREQVGQVIGLIQTLGDLRTIGSVELLLSALDDSELPRTIQRELISALGRIGDPRAVSALIAAQFWIPDAPGTLSVGERSLRALGAIGEAALPGVLATFAGGNRRVSELAEQVGVPEEIVHLSMVKALAVIASPRATEPLLDKFPLAGCGRTGQAGQAEELVRRAFYANALGFIADPAAVLPLCACNGASEDPTDTWEIASALGRIGGEEAYTCLASLVDQGRYDPDMVDKAMELQIRWQSFRWAVIAAPPSKAGALSQLLSQATPAVRATIEREQTAVGVTVLRECGEDLACYAKVLGDAGRHPFAREVAAFNLARRARPGDLELAAALAAGFATPDPEVRINMAWLAAKVAAGRACPACITELERVMAAEAATKAATMQGAWLTARQTIDKAHTGTL